MRYTNKANLPEPMVKALTFDDYDYDKAGDISITGLITPPRIRQLMKRHDDEIVVDVSDRIWLLLGNSVHIILERMQLKNVLQEERLSTEIKGWQVTGKPDLLDQMAALTDYKVTSTWSVIL